VSGTDHRKRLMAILAADAAGYSRLMAVDEAATVAALDAARAVFRE
jgi:adenylate cyclase